MPSVDGSGQLALRLKKESNANRGLVLFCWYVKVFTDKGTVTGMWHLVDVLEKLSTPIFIGIGVAMLIEHVAGVCH